MSQREPSTSYNDSPFGLGLSSHTDQAAATAAAQELDEEIERKINERHDLVERFATGDVQALAELITYCIGVPVVSMSDICDPPTERDR